MNVLLDQGLPRSTVRFLEQFGLAAEHVGDLGMATSTDIEILDQAVQRNAFIVTLDADFHSLLAIKGAQLPSVIRIRIEGMKGDRIARIIQQVIESAKDEIAAGAAITVTPANIRVRRLPIGPSSEAE